LFRLLLIARSFHKVLRSRFGVFNGVFRLWLTFLIA